MPEPHPPPINARWDLLNPTNINAGILLAWAAGILTHPQHPDRLTEYRAFDDVAPWVAWGYGAGVIAALLVFTPRGGWWRMFAHFLASTFFLGISSEMVASAGFTGAALTFGVLSATELMLFGRTFVYWARQQPKWKEWVEWPPFWLRWLA